MSLRKRIIANAGSNWLGTVVNAAVAIVLVPVILTRVGVEGYGVWALLARGLSYVAILDRALVLAVNRFVAFYRDDWQQRNRVVSASFVILGCMAILTIIGAVLISFFVTDIFRSIPAQMAREAQITCVLVGVTFACRMIEANFSGALMGYERYVCSNGVLILSNILRAIFTVLLLFVWRSIIALQVAFLASALISVVLMYVVAKRTIPGLSVGIRYIDVVTIRELFSYTSHSIARSGGTAVMYNTMTVLVGWAGTATDVAVYDIAFRIPVFVRGFLAGTQNVFLPTVTNLCAKGEDERIKAVVTKGTHMVCILTCVSAILMYCFADKALAVWLKGAVPDATVIVMRVLTISIVAGGIFDIWLPVLVGMGHLKGLTVASILMTVLSILLALILLQTKAVTVPMAPAVALLVVLWIKSGIWMPLYGIHKLGMSHYEYFSQAIFTPIIASVLSIVSTLGLSRMLQARSVHWFVTIAVSATVTIAIFAIVSLRSESVDILRMIGIKLGLKRQRQI